MSGFEARVAFDVTPVISGGTGIARYVNQLDGQLSANGVRLERFAIGRASHPPPPGTRRLAVPSRLATAWWSRVPRPHLETAVPGVDLVHATGMFTPRTGLPLVVTVHDLAALRHPELHPPRHVEQQRAQLRSLRRAAAILAVSEVTARDLAGLGFGADRVIVSPLGVSARPPASPEASPARGCVLAVGETAPRKRLEVLLRALARVRPEIGLVIAGPPAADEERLAALVAQLGLTARVKRLGQVGEAELSALYRDAVALCFPSVAEGFGLPVLEAMAAGLPVLARDMPITREVAGEAAMLIAGEDPVEWAAAIERVTADVGLHTTLGDAGPQRAARFTWTLTAQRTLDAYRLALGGAG